MNTYFISDLHFGHKNIIKYENRPFEDTDEMDTELVKRWNNTVGKNDTVWFLGDLAFGKKPYVAELVSKLKGHKKMVMGNHDHFKIKDYYEMGFEFVSPVPIILKQKFILSHAPIEDFDGDRFFNIFGHVHGSESYPTKTTNSQCVCVERQDYKPVRIPEFDKYQYSFKEYHPELCSKD